jgi:hypothetical protein
MQQSFLFQDNGQGDSKPTSLPAFPTKRDTRRLLKVVQEQGVDQEWYPTCEKQIACIKADILKEQEKTYRRFDKEGIKLSVLDVGAGDGRTLVALTDGPRYAIENCMPLVHAMDSSIMVIGSDFLAQSLFDKKTSILFSNPPYSEFVLWACKIIREASSAFVYLILPERWSESVEIQNALKARGVTAESIGSFDYAEAHRVARAKVNIVKIVLGGLAYHGDESYTDKDPFSLWFDEQFPVNAAKTKASQWEQRQQMADKLKESIAAGGEGGEIVKREGLIRLLETAYNAELQQLFDTYTKLTTIPRELLMELEISLDAVKASLKMKVSTLKDLYWKELFSSLDTITDKLCTESRNKLQEKLMKSTHVDFSEANAVAIVIWIIKQANIYYDQQVISVFETMTELANVQKYRSNVRTIKEDRWRYGNEFYTNLGPYGLDYRIILEKVGGYKHPDSIYSDSRCGLAERARNLCDDLVTLANNIGFDSVGNIRSGERKWLPGKPQLFYFMTADGKKEVLFEAKAFKNSNTHFRLNQCFIQKLNVVHGRLKGWLRSAADACEEMDIAADLAEEAFNVQLSIGVQDVPLLRLAAA